MSIVTQLREDTFFTQSERTVADYVLAHLDDVAHMTITELATHAHVSSSVVVRMCRKVGAKGFRDLRSRIASELHPPARMAEAEEPSGKLDSSAIAMRQVAHIAHQAIDISLHKVPSSMVDEIAWVLHQSTHVLVLATGPTRAQAAIVALMLEEGGRACTIIDPCSDEVSIPDLSPTHLSALFLSCTDDLLMAPSSLALVRGLNALGCEVSAITGADADDTLKTYPHVIFLPSPPPSGDIDSSYFICGCLCYVLVSIFTYVHALDCRHASSSITCNHGLNSRRQ